MKSDRWQRIERICHEALEHEPSRRAAFLEQACAGDETLRREVEDLLSQETKAEGFLEAPALEVEAKAMARGQADPRLGQQVGSYEIVSLLGAGGMGEVYLARDATLGRKVALKFLPDFLQQDDTARRRFVQEAKLAAALDHPFLCKVYEIGEEDERVFISLEYVRGQTLREKLAEGPLALQEAWKTVAEIGEALAEAHQRGIVHRDLKPANIMFTPDGHVKVMDFGLAKQLIQDQGPGGQEQSLTGMTKTGTTVGTLPYMSPEQVRGQKMDTRSDLFSLGVMLYEMLTGEHPFRRSLAADTAVAILGKEPEPVRKLRPEVTEEPESVVMKLLAKRREDRWQSAEELRAGLIQLVSDPSSSWIVAAAGKRAGLSRATRVALSLAAVVALAAMIPGYRYYSHRAQVRWARQVAIPEVGRLIEDEQFVAAFHLAAQVEQDLPEDPVLEQLWPQISLSMSVETEPPGADVYVRNYADTDGEWRHWGLSPVEGVRLPLQSHRWRVSKKGYATVDRATSPTRFGEKIEHLQYELRAEDSVPTGMLSVVEGRFRVLAGALNLGPLELDSFLIDRSEVTNREFQQFVDAGGYRDPRYWQHEFVKDGRVLSREEAVVEFRDATGRPGPSTWSLGTFPEGEGDFPVAGVNWYEAAAYAEFVGKSLPTVHHWYRAAAIGFAPNSVPLSNFSGKGPAPVETHQGISPWGVYDMAGNVREWCWNASGRERFILGGAWGDADYMFYMPDTQSPFDRAPTNGFRCVQYEGNAADLTTPIELVSRDYASELPVDDRTFGMYRSLYEYDQTKLNARSETLESGSPYWNKERITFDAAYGGERVTAYLFLPTAGRPPYQTVVFCPGVGAFQSSGKSDNLVSPTKPIVRSGRVMLHPVYKGFLERKPPGYRSLESGGFWDESVAYRDEVIMDVKDLARSIDYLETRSEIASDQVAYVGYSYGGMLAPIFLAVEERLKTAVLRGAGLSPYKTRPEIDPLNFVSRVKQPVLVLGGRYDSIYPPEPNQLPMLGLLGTPEQHKKLRQFDSAHLRSLGNEEIREILDWLDRYLGPVNRN